MSETVSRYKTPLPHSAGYWLKTDVTLHHTVKAYGGSGGKGKRIVNLDTNFNGLHPVACQ
jgi:hypothetical protein